MLFEDSLPMERIYLGGLDPPRLTAQHVVARLKDMPVEIENIEDHPDKSFCHLTARSTEPTSSKTALEIISSRYHNVKWKGCRLQVQAARPHFLQRLEEERKLRREQKEKLSGMEDLTQKPESTIHPERESFIPRRLRIRRKYGDEAVHVDTKPWSVESWKNFSRATGKQRKREQKHLQDRFESRKDPSIAPAPLMHRAIHIRFSENQKDTTLDVVGPFDTPRTLGIPALNDTDESSQTEGETNESSDDSEDEVDTPEDDKVKNYAWSDGSSVEQGESDSTDHDPTRTKQSLIKDVEIDSVEEEVTSEEESCNSSDDQAEKVSGQGVTARTEKSYLMKGQTDTDVYQWSSSEDESSEDDAEFIRKLRLNRPFRQVSETDDFAAGLDLDGENHFSASEDEDDEHIVPVSNEIDCDLKTDVSSNLNILSRLFSDFSSIKPVDFASEDEEISDGDNSGDKKEMICKTGFASSGIMLRFDPSAASANQFEIKEPEMAKEENKQGVVADQDESGKEELDEAEDVMGQIKDNEEEPKEPEAAIYEQDMLEDVFREARQGWAATSSMPSHATDGDAPTGGFSFGFDLGLDTVQEVDQRDKGAGWIAEVRSGDAIGKDEGNLADFKDDIVEERRIRGFRFPFSSVEKYARQFYEANDGRKIMEDIDAFRNDPDVKESWKKERYNLTLDWKRKKKHAQSRIQKRVKIR